jgi:hypothetical protein
MEYNIQTRRNLMIRLVLTLLPKYDIILTLEVNFMKRYLNPFLFIMLFLLIVVGCSPADDDNDLIDFDPILVVVSESIPNTITTIDSLVLPTTLTIGQYQVEIVWSTDNSDVISANGQVLAQPGYTGMVKLTAVVTINNQTKTLTNNITVSIPAVEVIDYNQQFIYIFEQLTTIMPTEAEELGLIGLPETIDQTTATIAWISSNTRRITDAGEVIQIGESDLNVTLTAVVTINDQVRTSNYVVKVLADKEYLFKVAEEYLRYYLKSSTNRDFKLYDRYPSYPSSVTYVSSHPEVLGHDGTYTKTSFDTTVDLTVSITMRNETRSFIHKVYVIGPTDAEKVQAIGDWAIDYINNAPLGSVTELPTTHPQHKGTIDWFSNDVGVIEKNRLLIQPMVSRIVDISINIRVNFQTLTVNYRLDQAGNANLTEEQLLDEWIIRNLSGEITSVYNLFDGKGIEVRQVLLQPTAPFYTNITPGLMRAVPQSTLDSLFYPGYQMPNPENILWIVIHETGNRNNGAGALAHSNLQVNRSNNGFGSDATASWHYTVDDKYVYQNIPDHRRAIHAGDGSNPGTGNSNGIGIEMAINGDGNYEASLRNYAKLVAQLMYRYNLTFANVKQHNHFSSYGKNCPEIMRNTNRWFEFLDMVAFEYRAIELLDGVTVSWVLSNNNFVSQWHSETTLLYVSNRPTNDVVVDLSLIITKDSISKEYEINLTVKS